VTGRRQKRPAGAVDIHRSHLSLILSGDRVVQLDTLVKLAGALGVEPAELLSGVRWVSDGKGGGEFEL
jgi:transcriptional regulator with XRE-family HTH domain